MALGFKKRWRSCFNHWLERRAPAATTVSLDQRRIFVLPTLSGYFYIFIALLIFLIGINYRNSLAYFVSFLMVSLFIVAILHTYRNLSGLTVTGMRAGHAFAGEDVGFELSLHGERAYEAIELGWPDSGVMQEVNVWKGHDHRLTLYSKTGQRGWYRPGRLCIATRFPLGLLRAWSWLDFDFQALIYPKPEECRLPMLGRAGSNEGSGERVSGRDDFAGLRRYRPGDPLNLIAWKQLGKAPDLLTKVFESRSDQRLWLRWQDFSGADIERRLSQMCYWILECERRHWGYGMALPGLEFAPDLGDKQRQQCLQAIALYGVNS